ncbi:threonylcarbamoyl-AMP synthase [Candidatus Bathyarchaeota archaeon]|nr:threonylcarbamoyl-AMP synthase [Candidatus Bathyarchaeota archaeon]
MRLLEATEENIRRAATIVKLGGLVVYPTETVYGLGCAPHILEAAERLCKLKGRSDKPLPLICHDTEFASKIVELNPMAMRLAERFWPGPLTLVLPAKQEYSRWVTHGASTLALRVPGHPVSRELARLSGGVIVSTSANTAGAPPARTAQEAAEALGDGVNIILDGGPSPGDEPSTILDISGEHAWILRSGPVSAQEIKEVLGL